MVPAKLVSMRPLAFSAVMVMLNDCYSWAATRAAAANNTADRNDAMHGAWPISRVTWSCMLARRWVTTSTIVAITDRC
jgi:hypothetical protein